MDQTLGQRQAQNAESAAGTVAAAQGAFTTGQAKIYAAHAHMAQAVMYYLSKMGSFDISMTNGDDKYTFRDFSVECPRPIKFYPGGAPQPQYWEETESQRPMPIFNYEPKFKALTFSINMGMGAPNTRIQLFVRGPYIGQHRYVASVPEARDRHKAAVRAATADQTGGFTEPSSELWRPTLVWTNAAGDVIWRYSFWLETVRIVQELVAWNSSLVTPQAQAAFGVDIYAVINARNQMRQEAFNAGLGYIVRGVGNQRPMFIPEMVGIWHRANRTNMRVHNPHDVQARR